MLVVEKPGFPMNVSTAVKEEVAGIYCGNGRTAVDKAMVVLTALITSDVALSLTQLSQRTQLAKATVHRVLAVLVAYGMIARNGDRYSPGKMVQRDRRVEDRFLASLRYCSMPHLVELHKVTGHTASVSVLASDSPCHVNQIFGHRTPRLPIVPSGRRGPNHSAIEQVLRAYQVDADAECPGVPPADEFSETRRVGLAVANDPRQKVTSVAVPLGRGPRPVALALTGHLAQVDIASAARELRLAAYALSRALIVHRAAE